MASNTFMYECAKQYPILVEGYIDGFTTLHPTVALIAKRDRIEAWINTGASEPRWEAVGPSPGWNTLTFGKDPNEVILDCATKIRHQRLRIRQEEAK